MRYIWQHIHAIIESYNGDIPLTHFLKQYYRQYPKLGSRDRKILSEMAYSWYRCGKGLPPGLSFEDKVKACLQLTGTGSKHLQPFLPDNSVIPQLDISKLFLYNIPLSEGINKEDWLASMLQQPDVFLRLVKKDIACNVLEQNNIPFREITGNCIAIPNGSAIDKILPPDSYAIQDASSQQTTAYFNPADNESWWDCCSGAGGKSLALCSMNRTVRLTVSDKRDSILHNLVQRFRLYNLPLPEYHILDMADSNNTRKQLGGRQFNNIICDVPCTGSGTWARTPEQLYFFNDKNLQELTALQAKILINAAGYLQPGGRLFYITCSVFRQENEDVINAVTGNTGLKIQERVLINGINIKADSMFIAILCKK